MMAMTKAVKSVLNDYESKLAAAKHEIRIAAALSWTTSKEPKTIDTPYGQDTIGWSSHWHPEHMGRGLRIELGMSNGVSHNPTAIDRASTQGAGYLYGNRMDALLAARHKAARWCAEQLAAIDLQIEKEQV